MHIIELGQPRWNLKFNQNEIWNIFQVPPCQCNLPTVHTNLVYVSGYFQQLKVDYTRHEPNYLLKNVEIDQLPNIIFLTSVGDNFLNISNSNFKK